MGKTKTALMSGEAEPKVKAETTDAVETTRKTRGPKVRGKKYSASKASIDRDRLYPLNEAIELVTKASYSSFVGTVELHLILKKEGLSVQVALPHSSGQSKKIEFADEKTIEKLQAGKVDFDVLLATADMMPKLVPFARILGPRGMMPNPKNGTLVKSAKDAEKFNTDKITVKTEKKAPLVHTIIGKADMKTTDLVDNAEAIMNTIQKRQIVKAYVCASMSPSAKIDLGL